MKDWKIGIRMKKILPLLILASSAFCLEQPLEGWSLQKVQLHFIDWNKSGKTKSNRIEILQTYRGKTKIEMDPFSIKWEEYGVKYVDHGIPEFPMGLIFFFKEKYSEKITEDTLWVGRGCEVEYFVGKQQMKDSLIAGIFSGATKEIKKEIFKSKKCHEIIKRIKSKTK